MKSLSSITNPEIKAVIALHEAKGRKKQDRYIAEGIRVITTIIEAGQKPLTIYVTEPMIEQTKKLGTLKNITLVSMALMKKMSTASTASGMLAVFEIPHAPQPEELSGGLVLAQISDPGNMGTLIRTCAAMAIKSLVIVEGVDPYH